MSLSSEAPPVKLQRTFKSTIYYGLKDLDYLSLLPVSAWEVHVTRVRLSP